MVVEFAIPIVVKGVKHELECLDLAAVQLTLGASIMASSPLCRSSLIWSSMRREFAPWLGFLLRAYEECMGHDQQWPAIRDPYRVGSKCSTDLFLALAHTRKLLARFLQPCA